MRLAALDWQHWGLSPLQSCVRGIRTPDTRRPEGLAPWNPRQAFGPDTTSRSAAPAPRPMSSETDAQAVETRAPVLPDIICLPDLSLPAEKKQPKRQRRHVRQTRYS